MALSTLRYSRTDCFLRDVTIWPRHVFTRLRKGREINWLWLSKLHQEGCCNCTGFPGGNDCSGASDPNSRCTRHFPAVSKLCKCLPRTQCAIRECWLLCLFLSRTVKTVLSEDFPTKKRQEAWFSQKTQVLDETCCHEEGGNAPVWCSVRLETASIQVLLGEKVAFSSGSEF